MGAGIGIQGCIFIDLSVTVETFVRDQRRCGKEKYRHREARMKPQLSSNGTGTKDVLLEELLSQDQENQRNLEPLGSLKGKSQERSLRARLETYFDL